MRGLIKAATWVSVALAYAMLPFGMTVLSAARNTQSREAKEKRYAVAVAKVYKGSLVCLNTAGYLGPAADTAGYSGVVGVADETVDNTAGSAGDLWCRVI